MFTPDTKRTLRSGQAVAGQWRDINRVSGAHQHTAAEAVNHGHTIAGHPRQLRTPLGGGLTFRGEYDPTETYGIQDVVVIRSGANAGSYVCLQKHSGQAPQLPDVGNGYWMSLSGNVPGGGNWM